MSRALSACDDVTWEWLDALGSQDCGDGEVGGGDGVGESERRGVARRRAEGATMTGHGEASLQSSLQCERRRDACVARATNQALSQSSLQCAPELEVAVRTSKQAPEAAVSRDGASVVVGLGAGGEGEGGLNDGHRMGGALPQLHTWPLEVRCGCACGCMCVCERELQ